MVWIKKLQDWRRRRKEKEKWARWCPYIIALGWGCLCTDRSRETCEKCVHSSKRSRFISEEKVK